MSRRNDAPRVIVCDHPGCTAEIDGRLRGGWQVHWTHVRRATEGLLPREIVSSSRRRDYCPVHAALYRERDSVVLETK